MNNQEIVKSDNKWDGVTLESLIKEWQCDGVQLMRSYSHFTKILL